MSPLFGNDGPADETAVVRNPVPPPNRGGRRQPVAPPPGSDTPPYVQAPADPPLYDDGLFGGPAGGQADGRPTILANQANGWEENLQEIEVVRSSRTGLVLLFLVALLVVAVLALGLAVRSVLGGGGDDETALDTGEQVDETSTTLATDTTVPPPSVSTTVAIDPATQLRVTVAEDPFLCDSGTREFALIGGADPNEQVAFSSPQTEGLRSGTADANGELPIRWQCDPAQAGTTWELTATGETSGRTVTFIFAGVSSPGDAGDQGAGTTPTSDSTPTTATAPVALTVDVIEDPFVCDGEVRVFAGISGADPNESVAFSSPQSSGLRAGQADADGNLPVRWQCDAAQVGTMWELTATGETSGRTVTFTFTGG